MQTVIEIFIEALRISLLVLLMMIIVDIINVKTSGKLDSLLMQGKKWKQYIIASIMGSVPGCLGSFAGVSLYIHGMLSFGALTGLMLATAGDEIFVMLVLIPDTTILIIFILLILGIFAGWITDLILKKFSIFTCVDCKVEQYHAGKEGYKHYLKDHLWKHIIKKHFLRILLWTFGALLAVEFVTGYFEFKEIGSEYIFLILIFAAFIGIIPESGPHLIFVTLFAEGVIPFSVLLTSSIVQDGHGLLPLLSHSVKDTILIKLFNMIFGLLIGITIFLMGF